MKQLTSPGRLSNTGRVSDVHNEQQDLWEHINVFECLKPWLDIIIVPLN